MSNNYIDRLRVMSDCELLQELRKNVELFVDEDELEARNVGEKEQRDRLKRICVEARKRKPA